MNLFLNRFGYRVVFLRHGESVWNKENRFTGWHDVVLADTGILEAKKAGQTLLKEGFVFDQVYTSVLTRAIQTYNIVADELKCHHLPVVKSWRLNERHYGGLQGLNKTETAAKHGEQQPQQPEDPRNPVFDIKYKGIPKDALPLSECLKDTVARVIPFWHDYIARDILAGKQVLVVAHGNSIRSIVKYLDNVSEKDILELNIPTSVPLVYQFDENLKAKSHAYLGDQEEIRKKIAAVAGQGSKK
ncbi:hypothetical protein pb186bvf_019902 [Paramecium bursaria]